MDLVTAQQQASRAEALVSAALDEVKHTRAHTPARREVNRRLAYARQKLREADQTVRQAMETEA